MRKRAVLRATPPCLKTFLSLVSPVQRFVRPAMTMVSSMPRIDVFFARRAIRLSLKAQITVLLLVAKDTLKLSSTTRLSVANAI